MRILYIWDADYPWDIRVEKICNSLKNNGHEVYIAARNLKRLTEYENLKGLHIHRLKTWKNEKLNYAISFPAFFSPIWKHFLDSIICDNGIDLIIVRDLPMAIAGIWSGRRNRIPVTLDMAEDYVSMIWDIWRARKFQGLNLLVRNPYLAKYVERYTFRNIDHILVVVEEAKDVVLKGGGEINKITIVGNTPSLELFENNYTYGFKDDLELIKNRYSAIYTGGIQMGRGIQVVLDAIPEVVKEIPDFLFVIIGDGYAKKQLKELVIKKQLHDYVLWKGWIDHKNIFDYIKVSKVGVIPHLTSDHVNTTMPNKIFDYMGCGLPVVASDSVPMRRILTEERCGLTFRSGDAEDLSSTILKIFTDNYDYGKNGKESVKNRYNWEQDERRLLSIIEGFE